MSQTKKERNRKHYLKYKNIGKCLSCGKKSMGKGKSYCFSKKSIDLLRTL